MGLLSFDESSSRRLFEILWPVAYQAAASKVLHLSQPEIEDAAMVALTEVWQKLADLDSLGGCKAYVARASYRRAVSLLRRKTAEKRGLNETQSLNAPIDGVQGLDSNSGSFTLEDMICAQDGRDLHLCEVYELACGSLSSKERLVVDAFYLEGLAYHEISEQMNIPIGTVGTTIQRALKRLRKILDENTELRKEVRLALR